jgi:hypothetical protein
MKRSTKLTLILALLAVTPVFSVAFADPTPATVNPNALTATEVTKASGALAKALRPGPAVEPTGPCRAELSMDRFEITPSADRSRYDVAVTISNIGSEAAIGGRSATGSYVGISLDVTSNTRARVYFAQMADIDTIQPGANQTFTGSIAARELGPLSRNFTAMIDRGPDGPRCAYDARRNNDGLGVSTQVMRDWIAAGNASYVRTR